MFLICFIFFILIPIVSYANPACPICTVAIGASLGVAKKLGIADSIVCLWAGALLILLGYWMILFFDKKKWNFKYKNPILLLLSFSMIGTIYINELVYTPKVILYFLYIDPTLLSAIIGAIIFVYSQKLYQYMKKNNGGHAHFPFEKVVLPVVLLIMTSLLFHFINF